MTDPWCNGSTLVFGTISRGSNPCGSTFYKRNHLNFKWLFFCNVLEFNGFYILFTTLIPRSDNAFWIVFPTKSDS